MAGILDILNAGASPSVRGAQGAASTRLGNERTSRLANLISLANAAGSPAAARGLAAGGLVSQAFGGRDEVAINESPEVRGARQNAAIIEGINALEEVPGTAAHATASGRIAQEAGRSDLALRFAEQSAQLRKAESVAQGRAATAEREERRAQFKQFPSAVQEEIIAKSPDILARELNVTPARAAEISAKVEERNSLQRAKAAKTLNEVRKATSTKVSGTDVSSTSDLLNTLTDGQFDGDSELETAAHLVAQRAQSIIDAAKDEGVNKDITEARSEAWAELQNEGIIEHNPGETTFGFTFGEELSIDPERLKAPTKREGVLKL